MIGKACRTSRGPFSARPDAGAAAVAAALVAVIISNGIASSGVPIFYRPIIDSMVAAGHITPPEGAAMMGTAASITLLVAGTLSLVVGLLVHRLGLKRVMVAGAVLLGAACVWYGQAERPRDVWMAHALFGAALATTGALSTTLLVANHVFRARGFALGFVKTGSNIGGALIPPLAVALVLAFDWRVALTTFSLLAWIVLLPITAFLAPGRRSSPTVAVREERHDRGSTQQRSPVLVRVALFAAASALFYTIVSVIHHLSLHLTSAAVGLDLATAGAALSALLLAAGVGKLLMGVLADRIGRRVVVAISCLATAAATFALTEAGAVNLYPLVIAFGVAYGGGVVAFELIAVETANSRRPGGALGAVILMQTIGASLGAFVTGRLASAYGGEYFVPFMVAGGVASFAAVCALAVLVLDRCHWRSAVRPQLAG